MYEITSYSDREQENEMDLYDIFDVIIKRKKIIIITSIVCGIIALCTALFYSKILKTEKYGLDFTVDYKILSDEDIQSLAGIKVLGITSLLNNNEIINELFTLKEIKDLYTAKKIEPIDGEDEAKKKFLKDILTITPLLDDQDDFKLDLKKYSIETKFTKKNKALHRLLITKMYDIINRKITKENMEKLEKLNKVADSYIDQSSKDLMQASNDIREIFKTNAEMLGQSKLVEAIQSNKNKSEADTSLMGLLIPLASSKIKNSEVIYDRFTLVKNKIEIVKKNINDGNLLFTDSSITKIKNKSIAILILSIGCILGICLGLCLAFFTEFYNEYKNRKKEKK